MRHRHADRWTSYDIRKQTSGQPHISSEKLLPLEEIHCWTSYYIRQQTSGQPHVSSEKLLPLEEIHVKRNPCQQRETKTKVFIQVLFSLSSSCIQQLSCRTEQTHLSPSFCSQIDGHTLHAHMHMHVHSCTSMYTCAKQEHIPVHA